MLDYILLTNAMINDYYEAFGVDSCIRYLHNLDLTRDDLLCLGFKTEDIDNALEDN